MFILPVLLDIDYSSENERKESSTTDSKNKYLHEILAPGSSGDSVLKVKKSLKPRNVEESNGIKYEDPVEAYRSFLSGGNIPARGFAGSKLKDDKVAERTVDYSEEQLNIHYKTVIRAEVKEEIPEQELDKRLEEKMRRVYAEMGKRKKEKQEWVNILARVKKDITYDQL